MVSPVKLAHVVLWTKRVSEMRDWYVTVLDGRVVYENAAMAFMTYDEEHHRIAVSDPDATAEIANRLTVDSGGWIGASAGETSEVPPADVSPPAPNGLSHIAFTYASLEDLLGNYVRLKEDGIKPSVMINHGPTTSMYYIDPDGNRVELQVDNFATVAEGAAFMESPAFARNPVGVPFDPDAWLERLRNGAAATDLMTPTW
jgi:catechol-2,3-dioxygenase